MTTGTDSERLWRGGLYSLLVVVIGTRVAIAALSAFRLGLIFWLEGLAVAALLCVNLRRSWNFRGPKYSARSRKVLR